MDRVRQEMGGIAQQFQQLNLQTMSRKQKLDFNIKYDTPRLLDNMINVSALSPSISTDITTDEVSGAQFVTRPKSIRTLHSRSY
jgi:hypothetical protein